MAILVPTEDEIRSLVVRSKTVPPLPLALKALLDVINDQVASLKEIEDIIRYDQALAVKILRVANSPFFSGGVAVRTLSRAVMQLGLDQVKSLCFCTLLMALLSDNRLPTPSQREELWKHVFATARIAQRLAGDRPWLSREEAYLLGLLHDLGWLFLAVQCNDIYGALCASAKERGVPRWQAECHYGLAHSRIGQWLAIRWGLPEIFQVVMEYHHLPWASPRHVQAVKLIYLADALASSREYPDSLEEEKILTICKELFITEEQWVDHQERLPEIWNEVDQLWNMLK